MKKILAITIMTFLTAGLFAQEEGENNPEVDSTTQQADTTKINLGDDTQLILIQKDDEVDIKFSEGADTLRHEESDDFTYWSGLDLAFTGVTVPSGQGDDWFDIREQNSVAFSLNPVETKIPIIKHYLGINTGLGITWQDYALPDSLNLVQVNDSIVGMSSAGIKYDKNKLKTGYIKVPLLLEINTSRKKSNNFHIAAGLIGGWNYRSLLKQRFEVNGDKTKLKTKGDYNINPFSLEATVRVGYGNLNLFATASATQLFEDGKGPEVYPFTVGVSLVAF